MHHNIALRYRPFAEQSIRCKTVSWEPGISFLFKIMPLHVQALFLELADGDELSNLKILQTFYKIN